MGRSHSLGMSDPYSHNAFRIALVNYCNCLSPWGLYAVLNTFVTRRIWHKSRKTLKENLGSLSDKIFHVESLWCSGRELACSLRSWQKSVCPRSSRVTWLARRSYYGRIDKKTFYLKVQPFQRLDSSAVLLLREVEIWQVWQTHQLKGKTRSHN